MHVARKCPRFRDNDMHQIKESEARPPNPVRARRFRRSKVPSVPGRLPECQNIDMSAGMEELFGNPAYKGFVLQDKKRLPSRFFARISGALTSRLI
jgi:hypothetical protein